MLSASGCGIPAQAADLMTDVSASIVNTDVNLAGDNSSAVADFSVKLFQSSASADTSTLLSPLSVLCALAMTANGAKNETLTQMEDVFGLSVPALNEYMHTYLEHLSSSDKCKFNIADSIWFKDDSGLTVDPDFLKTNADYYGASIYKAPFDESTLKGINNWVDDHTGHMIPEILDSISPNAVMYLINALAFDAEWQTIYTETQIQDGTFTAESGETQDVKMMHGEEHQYLDDGSATGFIKYYAGQKYAFAALLPNEDVPIHDYIASLTGEGLMSTLENAQSVPVNTVIPKFKSESSLEMSDILKSMGMTDAFDPDSADFAGLGQSKNENIFIGEVLHKTYIAVDERGTKAGAATAVAMNATSALADQPKAVYLDRPFVYLLIDCETNLPIFIGTTMDVSQ
jgi:serpin B